MAGYSTTPLPTKLGIKPGARVLALNAPADIQTLLQPWPLEAQLETALRGEYGVIITFEKNPDHLIDCFNKLIPHLENRGGLGSPGPRNPPRYSSQASPRTSSGTSAWQPASSIIKSAQSTTTGLV